MENYSNYTSTWPRTSWRLGCSSGPMLGRGTLWSIRFFFFPGMMLAVLFCLVFLFLSLSLYICYMYIYIYIESATWLVSAQVFDGHFLTLAMWRMTHGHGRQSITLDSNGQHVFSLVQDLSLQVAWGVPLWNMPYYIVCALQCIQCFAQPLRCHSVSDYADRHVWIK